MRNLTIFTATSNGVSLTVFILEAISRSFNPYNLEGILTLVGIGLVITSTILLIKDK